MATSGVQQGDPLGPLLFALVLQPLLLKIYSEKGLTVAAYLDDVTLCGPAERVSEVLQWLSVEGPQSGLYISPVKTIIWSPLGKLMDYSHFFQNYQLSYDEGLELLGAAVSTSPEYNSQVAEKRIFKCIESLHRLLMLKDPQLCLILLRACEGMPKLVYCFRTVAPEYIQDIATKFQDELINALRNITVSDGILVGFRLN